MLHQLIHEAPQNSHFQYAKYFSDERVAYNYMTNSRSCSKQDIDFVDKNLKVLCLFLQNNNFDIINYCAPSTLDTDNFRDLYNKLKRDEKNARLNGLQLTALDGSTVVYKNPKYRILYSSYESYARDYYKNMRFNFIVFSCSDAHRDILIQHDNLFDGNFTYQQAGATTEYMIYFDASKYDFANTTWRKYTETIVSVMREAHK